MTILDRLFEGSIQPSGRLFTEPEIKAQLNLVNKKLEVFLSGLTESQRDMYEEISTENGLLGCMYQKESFKDGFKLAVQFMKEAENYDSIKHLIDTENY
jgi:hypothetical protein